MRAEQHTIDKMNKQIEKLNRQVAAIKDIHQTHSVDISVNWLKTISQLEVRAQALEWKIAELGTSNGAPVIMDEKQRMALELSVKEYNEKRGKNERQS